jgi:bifunctional UDP-N-acetylglucosamine pyrophosphorylase/glucosamine-1-phosphate N-acetyltransferase
MQAVILAAGKATRLRPNTLHRSKAKAPIAGKPKVERVIETMVKNGIDDFILVISDDDQDIRRYFRSEVKLPARFQFVTQTERLGMAHAVGLAAPRIRTDFLLSACDSIVPAGHIADLLITHRTRPSGATLSLMELRPEQISRSSAVEIHDGKISRIVEKPTLEEAPSNIGSLPLYIFTPKLLDYLPLVQPSSRGEYELQDAIQMLIDETGPINGVLTDERVQLTNADDLLALNRHYLSLNHEVPHLQAQAIGPNTCLTMPVRIEAGTTLGPDCNIGPNVYIEGNCRIGANVTLRDAVVLRDTVIENGQQLSDEVIAAP